MTGFFSQLPYKRHFKEVAFVGDSLKICPQLDSRAAAADLWLLEMLGVRHTPVTFVARERLRVGWLGGVPREQKMLKGHLPRVIHHQVY